MSKTLLHPLLDFSVEGFRCFRERTEFTEPRHVNVVAGPNNSGKSSLLAVLRRLTTTHYPPAQTYRGSTYFTGDTIQMMLFRPSDITHGQKQFTLTFHQALRGSTLDGVVPPAVYIRGDQVERVEARGGSLRLTYGLPDAEEATTRRDAHQQTIDSAFDNSVKNIIHVPTVRHVRPYLHEHEVPDAAEAMFDGSMVLPKLLAYTNPSQEFGAAVEGIALHNVENTMSGLLGREVRLRPLPVERSVEVTIAGRSVSLQRLGAGVEQLLVLAFALSEYPEALLLIEEPENFLHPTLQRHVLEYLLSRKGDSILTTHSNHLLDVRDGGLAYYRTYVKPDGSAGVERINSLRKYDFLWDLGVRPSSLFESNATIWVEGPSDAILLRAWLSLLPEAVGLIEGVHYTFAFHAGSLLDKFFIDWNEEQAPDEQHIVNFCALHPNFFVVADSDGDGSKQYGHQYLERIAPKAIEKGILWASAGKEVENYLPRSILERYLTSRASPRRVVSGRPTDDDLRFKPIWKLFNVLCGVEAYSDYPNKVAFSEWAASELHGLSPDEALGVLDLRDRLQDIVRFISRASGRMAATQQAGSEPPLS